VSNPSQPNLHKNFVFSAVTAVNAQSQLAIYHSTVQRLNTPYLSVPDNDGESNIKFGRIWRTVETSPDDESSNCIFFAEKSIKSI
jgi:hypothetical protein